MLVGNSLHIGFNAYATNGGDNFSCNLTTSKRPNGDVDDMSPRANIEFKNNMPTLEQFKYFYSDIFEAFNCDIDQTAEEGCTLLYKAASRGQLSKIRNLVANGADPNIETEDGRRALHVAAVEGYEDNKQGSKIGKQDHRGYTPLHIAAAKGHLEIVKYLTDQNCHKKEFDHTGFTPLALAAIHGHLDIVKYLADWKDDAMASLYEAVASGHFDIVKFFGDHAYLLRLAAHHGFLDIVQYLVQQGVDVNNCDENGWKPLEYAIQNNNCEVIEYLVTNGAKANQCNEEGPLYMASRLGHLNAVKVLISRGFSVNAKSHRGQIPLHAAAATGRIQVDEILIENGSDLNKTDIDDGSTPLHAAVQNGHLEVVRYLMWNGAIDIECRGMTSLYIAAQNGHLDIVDLLLSNGADVNEEDDTGCIPLHAAAANGSLEIIVKLINHGSNVNKMAGNGWTPLHAAVYVGRLDVVRYLISHGAIKTRFKGMTILYLAAQCGHTGLIEYFATTGCDVNEGTDSGKSPLLAASYNGDVNSAEILVIHGASISQADENKCTPIHAAAQEGHLPVVTYLVENGADTNAKDTDGMTPLQAAVDGDHEGVKQYLLRLRANVQDERHNDTEKADGMTPLQGAEDADHQDVQQRLIQFRGGVQGGRHKDTTKTYGMTPLQAAEGLRHQNVQKCLIRLRAEVQNERHKDTKKTDGIKPPQAAEDAGDEDVQQRLIQFRGGVKDERHKGKEKTDGIAPLQAAEGPGYQDVQQRLIRFRGGLQDERHKCTEKTDEMTPLQAAEDAGHQGVQQCLIHSRTEVLDGRYDDTDKSFRSDENCLDMVRGSGMSKVSACDRLSSINGESYNPMPLKITTASIPMQNPWRKNPDSLPRHIKKTIRPTRESCVAKPKTQLYGGEVPATDDLAINRENSAGDPKPGIKNPRRTNPDSLSRHIKTTIRSTRMSCVSKPNTQLNRGEVPATNNLTIKSENDAVDQKQGIKSKRRNIENGPSIPTLLHQAILALAIFFACTPVLVAGNVRWVEPVTLDVGTRGVVPFYLQRPSSSVQFSLLYTIQFGSKSLPFCINGQYVVDAFKDPSQLSRFTTTVLDRDASPCVNMTIDDVHTIDGDQYIFIGVWRSSDIDLYDTQKKEVIVQRPPGPADCFITLSDHGDSEFPYELHCSAKTGSKPTTLTCYQNDRDLVKVHNITDNGLTIRAIFFLPDTTRFSCCSHDIISTVDVANCNDFEWPPGYSGIPSTGKATSRSKTVSEQSNRPADSTPPAHADSDVGSGALRSFMVLSHWHFLYLLMYLLVFVINIIC